MANIFRIIIFVLLIELGHCEYRLVNQNAPEESKQRYLLSDTDPNKINGKAVVTIVLREKNEKGDELPGGGHLGVVIESEVGKTCHINMFHATIGTEGDGCADECTNTCFGVKSSSPKVNFLNRQKTLEKVLKVQKVDDLTEQVTQTLDKPFYKKVVSWYISNNLARDIITKHSSDETKKSMLNQDKTYSPCCEYTKILLSNLGIETTYGGLLKPVSSFVENVHLSSPKPSITY